MVDTSTDVAVMAPAEGPPHLVVPEFSIVPLRALPGWSRAVLIGLVVAIAGNCPGGALDWFHVVGGGLWTGIDLFVGLIIGPILGKLSAAGRGSKLRARVHAEDDPPDAHPGDHDPGRRLAARPSSRQPQRPLAQPLVRDVVHRRRGDGGHRHRAAEPANLAVLFELKKPWPDGELIGRLMRVFVYTAGITGVLQVATLLIMTKLAVS